MTKEREGSTSNSWWMTDEEGSEKEQDEIYKKFNKNTYFHLFED